MEGERLRPNLTSLLELADYVTMSAKFPQVLFRLCLNALPCLGT